MILNTGETATNVWYRIMLTVRDSTGLTNTTFRDILPRVVNLTLSTTPSGPALKLDGQPITAPFTTQSVAGMIRAIEAPSPQSSSPRDYVFQSWSDGGAAAHNIVTPSSNK